MPAYSEGGGCPRASSLTRWLVQLASMAADNDNSMGYFDKARPLLRLLLITKVASLPKLEQH